VRCTTSVCVSPPGNRWFNRDKLKYAKGRGLRVIGTPDLVVVLYDRQHILLQEARTMLHSLLGVSTRIVEAAGVMLEGIARVRGEGQ